MIRAHLPAAAAGGGAAYPPESRAAGARLCAQLQQGADAGAGHPPWAVPLRCPRLAAPPAAITTWLQLAATSSLEDAAAEVFGDEVVDVPDVLRPVLSGESRRALRFRCAEAAAYAAAIFTEAAERSPVRPVLTGWDLSHAHAFVHTAAPQEGELPGAEAEAAELLKMPFEQAAPRLREVLLEPVLRRVRNDWGRRPPALQLRELLVHALAKAAPHTVHCGLGLLFHAREYPREYRASRSSPVLPIGDPRMGGERDPRTGTQCSTSDPDYPLRNYVWLLGSPQIVWLLDPRHEGFDRSLLSEPDDEFWTVVEDKLGAPVGDVNYFPAHGLLACPREGFEPSVYLASALTRLERAAGGAPSAAAALEAALRPGAGAAAAEPAAAEAAAEVRRITEAASGRRVTNLRRILSEQCPSAAGRRLPLWARPLLAQLVAEREAALAAARTAHDAKQLQDLQQQGVLPEHARQALRRTAAACGGISAMRAGNLLSVVFGRYRPPPLRERFGDRDWPWAVAQRAVRVAFHPDIALSALHRAEGGSELEDVAAQLVVEQEQRTRAAIHEQRRRRAAGASAATAAGAAAVATAAAGCPGAEAAAGQD